MISSVAKFKPAQKCEDDVCHVSRCKSWATIMYSGASAARYGRDEILLCDKHHELLCEEAEKEA